MSLLSNIFHAAGRVFAEGAYTPSVSPVTKSVLFAIPTEKKTDGELVAEMMKRVGGK
jgi:hypothetical protein